MEYLSEDELKAEIAKVQQTQRLNYLYKEKESFEISAKYNWEKRELEEVKKEIEQIELNGGDVNYPLDKFGSMILLLLKRIMSRHNFSGYTWKDDFYSDAIEKIFKYIHNFDPTLTSKITGKPVKAFAYLTQIAMHSFISVINSHKEEIEMMRQLVPLLAQDTGSNTLSQYREKYYESQDNEATPLEFEIDIDIREQHQLPLLYNSTEYVTIKDLIVSTYDNTKNYKLTMHKDMIIPIDDYEEIIKLNINSNALNITRFQYKASFPKKKSTKISVEELWFTKLGIDVDNEVAEISKIDVVSNVREEDV